MLSQLLCFDKNPPPLHVNSAPNTQAARNESRESHFDNDTYFLNSINPHC
jgi:hypothetical protein